MVKARLADDHQLQKLLLTRSPHLASKLKKFTKSLFESQMPTELAAGFLNNKDISLDAEDEMQETDTIFSVRNPPLPLACTFDWFLGLLENTVRLKHSPSSTSKDSF